MKRKIVAASSGLALIVLSSVTSTAIAQTTTAPAAAAETAPTPPAPGTTFGDFTLTGNAGLFSDYRFRGFTQTGYKPAFQGGFDLSHASGFYIGNWN